MGPGSLRLRRRRLPGVPPGSLRCRTDAWGRAGARGRIDGRGAGLAPDAGTRQRRGRAGGGGRKQYDLGKMVLAEVGGGGYSDFVTLALVGLVMALVAPASETQTYYVVNLRPSPTRRPLPKEEGEKLQAAHMAHIRSMAARGKLVAAGPFGDQPVTISGLFVFETATLAEARAEAEADPTVQAGRNLVEIYTWHGPKGVGAEYRRLHAEDPKTPEAMGEQPLAYLRGTAGWTAEWRARHEEYVARLRAAGQLAAAGPAEGAGLASVVVFDRIPMEEAERLVQADPAVRAGVLTVEMHRWWCAAHVLPWAGGR